MNNKKYIFSFWEPEKGLYDYLKLCINTWKKFMPDYEIVILNYKTLHNWIDKKIIDTKLFNYFSLPKQADVIRCLLLYKYGGIWFDTDTLVISKKINDIAEYTFKNSEISMIETSIKYHPYTGLIFANKNSEIFRQYIFEVEKRINEFGKPKSQLILTKLFNNKKYKEYKNWDFLGNAIIDKLINGVESNKYLPLDNNKIKAFPEIIKYPNISRREAYCKFWFKDNSGLTDLDEETSVISLHNSWTPKEYKKMTKNQFLSQDITLSNILKELL